MNKDFTKEDTWVANKAHEKMLNSTRIRYVYIKAAAMARPQRRSQWAPTHDTEAM